MKSLLTLFLFLSPTLVFAAPATGPAGETAGGIFSTYFSNIANTTCPSGSYITGFNTTNTSDYLKPTCTPLTTTNNWSLRGNTLTSGDFLGSLNNEPLIFRTNATTDSRNKMVILTGGSVGIGTDTPGGGASPILGTVLDVNGTTRATNFTDTTNGTWFPWLTTGNNYIRGKTYLSGALVDEQNINFFVDPAKASVMSGLTISGSISGPTPTQPSNLATKKYVDEAIAAGGTGGDTYTYQEFNGWTPQSCPSGWTYIAGGPIYGEGAGPTVVCGIKNNTGIIYREFGHDNNESCPTSWTYVGVGPIYGPGKSNIVCSVPRSQTLPQSTPVNGSCSTTVNTCTTGTPSTYSAGSCGGTATWTCNGSNGGSNASCTKTNAACQAATCNRSYATSGGTCYCAVVGGGTIWGSSPYTEDSDICGSAKHAGAPIPGNIIVVPTSTCSSFIGTTSNGITTNDYGSPWASYYIQGYGSTSCGAGGGGGGGTTTPPPVSAGTDCRTSGGTVVAAGASITLYESLTGSPLCHGQTATCDGSDGLLKSTNPYGSQSSVGSSMSFNFSYGWLDMNQTSCVRSDCNISSPAATLYQYYDTPSGQSYYCANGTTWTSLGSYSLQAGSCWIDNVNGKYLYNGGCAISGNRTYYCDNGTMRSTAAGVYDAYTKYCR